MRKTKRVWALLLCGVMLLGLLAGCGQSLESQPAEPGTESQPAEPGTESQTADASMESQLAGSWYLDGYETSQRAGGTGPYFTLYSDGTCKLSWEYGTGTWAVVNDNELKVTDFYGESMTAKIISVEGGCLTMEGGGVLWDSPINEDAG